MAGAASELGKREQEILRALVQDYIQTGEPVASQPLLARHDLTISPATVRNVMADLEALGFLAKPHASSGRIPTQQGYRLYVDELLQIRPPPAAERERIERLAHEAPQDLEATLGGTVQLLHSLSRHAGVVTTPRPVTDPIRQLEFVRLRENRVLVVFVSDAGLVTNKVLALESPMSQEELERAQNYLNDQLRRGPLEELRARILAQMREDQSALQHLVQKALTLAEQAFGDGTEAAGLKVEGEESFLDAPEFADVQKARALLKAFAEKDRILRVLDRVLRAREVRIFIGAESEFAGAPDVSVVAAPYGRGDKVLGTLAVVGPTRMNYAHVISLVDLTARELSRALSAEE
jgi:heat-inducible transcriptional repressor